MSQPAAAITRSAPNTIELRVEKLSQLFDPLDPLPPASRDLTPSAEQFIVGWMRDLPSRARVRILVHLPSQEAEVQNLDSIARGVQTYFGYRAERTASDLRELFRLGRTFLLIGLSMLALCLTAAQAATTFLPGPFGQFLANALVILGWVVNWRPIEILLYDWWPVLKRRKLYLRLAAAPVEFEVYADFTTSQRRHDEEVEHQR